MSDEIPDVTEKFRADCMAAQENVAARYKDREPCACTDMTGMEQITICLLAGVTMNYEFRGNALVITTKNKCGITWDGKMFNVAVLQERK